MGQVEQIEEAGALLAQAEGRLADGDLHGAFAAYKACLKAAPNFAPGLAGMGLFLAEHGDPGTAAQLLSQAMAEGDAAVRLRVAPAFARLLQRMAVLRRQIHGQVKDPAVRKQRLEQLLRRELGHIRESPQ